METFIVHYGTVKRCQSPGRAGGFLGSIKWIAHDGGLDGFGCHLARYPEHNVTVAAVTNCLPGGPAPGADRAGAILAEVYLWELMKPRKRIEIDKTVAVKTLGNYVGRYDYGGAFMTVSLEDDQLYGQLLGQPKIKFYPKSERVFFAKVVEASIEFVLDDEGNVDHVIHRQGGQEIKAPRVDAVQFVELSEDDLKKFVGKYDYGPIGKMTVVLKDGTLRAQLTGQPSLSIKPVSETAFEWEAVKARIEFAVDDAGKVTGGTHHQGGRELSVKRIE